MSRSHHRTKEALEQLRAENKKLNAEIKKLERKIEQFEKPLKIKSKPVKSDILPEPVLDTKSCSKCKSGDLVELDLGNKKYRICNECKDRKLVK